MKRDVIAWQALWQEAWDASRNQTGTHDERVRLWQVVAQFAPYQNP